MCAAMADGETMLELLPVPTSPVGTSTSLPTHVGAHLSQLHVDGDFGNTSTSSTASSCRRERRRPPSLFHSPTAGQVLRSPQVAPFRLGSAQCGVCGAVNTPLVTPTAAVYQQSLYQQSSGAGLTTSCSSCTAPKDSLSAAGSCNVQQTPCVSFSEDGSTLLVGHYRVTRDGCRTMRQHMIINPVATPSTSLGLAQVSPPIVPVPSMPTPQLKSTKMEDPVSPIWYRSDFDIPSTLLLPVVGGASSGPPSTKTADPEPTNRSPSTVSDGGSCCARSTPKPLLRRNSLVQAGSPQNSLGQISQLHFDDITKHMPVANGASGTVYLCSVRGFEGRHFALKTIPLSSIAFGGSAVHDPMQDSGMSNVSPSTASEVPLPNGSFTSLAVMTQPKQRQLHSIIYRELQMLHSHYRSPYIVKAYDAFYDQREMALGILMEYMDFGSLESLGRLLSSPGSGLRSPLPERVLAVVAENVLRGLHDMHQLGQIHRDIKPSNILVNKHGAVKLSDFGLADRVETIAGLGASDEAQAFICSGTEKYMSPERQRGEPHGFAADIWALGLSIAECAHGRYPIDLSDCVDLFDRIERMSNPQPIVDKLYGGSDALKDFISQCMLPKAADRPTAQELQGHPFLSMWDDPFDLSEYISSHMHPATLAAVRSPWRVPSATLWE